MTDAELVDYLGLQEYSDEVRAKFIAAIPPERRALFDKMLDTEQDIKLWQEGVGPKPTSVILCHEHKPRRRSQSDAGAKGP